MADIKPVGQAPQQKMERTEHSQNVPKSGQPENVKRSQPKKEDDVKKITDLDSENLQKDVEELNKLFKNLDVNFRFQLFDGTKLARNLVVQVKDRDSGAVVKVIPAQNFLKFKVSMERLRGVFLNRKA